MALHIVNQSPYRSSALNDCLAAMAGGDALLLIEDAVYAAGMTPAALPMEKPIPAETYCLKADAKARGVSVSEKIPQIDDDHWVTLCVQHTPIVSWF
ncbi:protein TusB [Microbulbifer aestuariivivens]|uniref:Protein TusB n=1 Tax=Microbulbifer aestuariivivens TaxID=1908308 RepID=A0ABP9WKE5_9GAMM